MVALLEEPTVHGYGETLVEARQNIRDAITTLFGPFGTDADGFELVEDVRLSEAILALVARAQVEHGLANQQRNEARAAEEAVAVATDEALMATHEAAALVGEHSEVMEAWRTPAGCRTTCGCRS